MNAYIYIEGGAKGEDSKYQRIQCQEAFHKLLSRMGFTGRKPRLVACGGRDSVYDRFCTKHGSSGDHEYIAMWIDSEEPMTDIENAWGHLRQVKTVTPWEKPSDANDHQVLFMTTCMETWIAADRQAMRDRFGTNLQENALPPLNGLEQRSRQDVQKKIAHATRTGDTPYKKGKCSFDLLGKLDPSTLKKHLPSFVRVDRILKEKLLG